MRFNNKLWADSRVSLHKLLNLNAKQPTVMTHALNLRTKSNYGLASGNFGCRHLYTNMESLLAGANYINMYLANWLENIDSN